MKKDLEYKITSIIMNGKIYRSYNIEIRKEKERIERRESKKEVDIDAYVIEVQLR